MNMSVLSASCRDPDSFEAVAGGIDKPLPFDCGATLVAGVTGEPCPFSCGVIGLNIALIKRLASPFATLSARAREREDFKKRSSICMCLLNFTTTVIQKTAFCSNPAKPWSRQSPEQLFLCVLRQNVL